MSKRIAAAMAALALAGLARKVGLGPQTWSRSSAVS